MTNTIDSAARVSPKAHLGTNVTIGPFTIVEEGAVLGDGTIVGANALIATGARIGNDCKIHHGAIVGYEPQDLKYAGEATTCEVGDRTVVREYATLHRGTGDGGRTVIGSDCFIMGYVHIAHDCILGNRIIMANAAMLAGHCEVADYAIIGGITPVHQFVRIGCHAMIGGGVRIPKDIPPYVLAGFSYQGLNSVGLRRRGFSPEVIAALDKTYNLIYNSKLNVSQATARIKENESLTTISEVQHVLTFISNSKRGIIGGPRSHR